MTRQDLAGKAMTVRGPIDPEELGVTLMHEHLFVAVLKKVAPNENTSVTDFVLWDQKLTLENLHLARAEKPMADNWVLSDLRVAIEEAMEFRMMGGGTVVELTSHGLRRDAVGLLKVSNATGLNIVMGSGWYQKLYHPADMDRRTVEDLSSEIIRDITEGVGNTGIRSGIIGEVGVEGEPIEPNEIKSIRASARASQATGAAISFHHGGSWREKFETIAIMEEEGVDLSRVIFGHSDPIAGDMPLMLELLGHGVYIQFDNMGRVTVPLDLKPPRQTHAAGRASAINALVAEAIPKLIEAGYVDRILLSQDVCTKVQLKRYGGTGYSYLLETFLPHLRARGVSDEDVRKMMVENPKRVLTLAEPAS